MNRVFAPGCALTLYKPELAKKLLAFLDKELGGVAEHATCCKHAPGLPSGTQVINVCAGCDRRYRTLYEGVTTISVWEVLLESRTFPFPDYKGKEITVQDACPTRDQARVHDAIRALLEKMNLRVTEPARTRSQGACCGDGLFGSVPLERVKEQMKKRADEMPVEDVAVYCVSCVKAMAIGGRKPRYMADLLFGESSGGGTAGLEEWHAELDAFIKTH